MKEKSLIGIVILQVLLMVLFPVSTSSILGEVFNEGEIVSAEEVSLKCCPETTSGAICQDLVSTNSAECKESLLSSECSDYVACSLGCCIDSDEGTCSTRAPKTKCESDGGIWKSDENCLVTECEKGCCILGNEAQFVTEKNCEKLSLTGGFQKDFRAEIDNEIDCLETVGGISQIVQDSQTASGSCIDEEGNARKNGESWCAYDGFIGEGKDVVGSRHWKQSCVDGKILTEGCGDYRGQICVQSTIEEDAETFSTASCIMNTGLQCLKYNEADDMAEKCNDDKMCMIKNINVDKGFRFDLCVGRYPRGFDLVEADPVDDSVCSLANQKCVVTYQKGFFSGWKCINNCNCEKAIFTEQMNDLCVSLGDCGSYVNYKGEGTNNIQVSNTQSISWEKYKNYAEPVKGQFAEPPEISDYLSVLGLSPEEFNATETDDFTKIVGYIGHIVGGSGTLINGLVFLGIGTKTTTVGSLAITKTLTSTTIATQNAGNIVMSSGLGAFAGVASGASLGGMAAYYLAKMLGIQGPAVGVMSIAGSIAGGIIGYGYTTMVAGSGIKGFLLAIGPGLYVAIAAIVVVAIIALSGWGKTKEVTVEFKCMPWQAPVGGNNCEKCNDDANKPCTEYRCSSLGQACKLLNSNEENPICESISYEPNPPVISLGEVFTTGYKSQNSENKRVEIRADDGGCIQEFTPILFTLETDEPAQCKYDFIQKSTYDAMDNYPVEMTNFGTNHSFTFSMPSIGSLNASGINATILQEYFENLDMYIRCQDYHGNFNINPFIVNFCVKNGPDITAVNHQLTVIDPANNSFLKYGTTSQNLKMWINEPAECKYDSDAGKTYDAMANSMTCKTSLAEVETFGWPCTTNLNIANRTNSFYIKCKDKPWVQTSENITKYGARNVNLEDFVYQLKVTANNLIVNYVSPQGKIESGSEPVTIKLEARTTKGADDGKATCYYNWGGNWIQFLNTFTTTHTQSGLTLLGGNHNISIKCEDIAGNVAYNNSVLNIEVDSAAPIATRVFYENNDLKLITNEKALCSYSTTNCTFDVRSGDSMTTIYSTEHSANWIAGQTYYIKCKDIWENVNSDCTIKVEPST